MAEEPSWLKALHDSYDSPLVFVKEVLGLTPEDWQAKAPEAVARNDRVRSHRVTASARPRVVHVHAGVSQLARPAP